MQNTTRRVLVIGLDAADEEVLGPLMDRGDLPHLTALFRGGAGGTLHSTVPPVSAPAWATFLTGRNPGRHGLYSFVVERDDGGIQLANLTDIHGPKIWDLAAAQGVRPVVVNVPVTWPAPAFDGVLVTGMLTPESQSVPFTHPEELGAEILERIPGYRIDVDRDLLDDKETLFQSMLDMAERRKELFLHLMKTQDWGLFVAIFTNTDRMQHSFWRERELVERFFIEMDAHVGELLGAIDRDETIVMVLSDHGFQSCDYKLYVNRFLEERGLLRTQRAGAEDEHYARRRPDYFSGFQGGRGEPKHGSKRKMKGLLSTLGMGGEVTMDWEQTRAFMWSLDTGGVAVNLVGRYPHGTVEPEDYEAVRDEVMTALSDLRLPDGRPAFRSVRRREDVYEGEFVARAPDVVVEPDDKLEFGMQLDAKEPLRTHKRPGGHHSPRGIIALDGPGCARGRRIEGNLVDCVATILHAAGLAVPEDTDGTVLVDAFEEPGEVRTFAPAATPEADATASAYSADEEEDLKRSLEGLGYL